MRTALSTALLTVLALGLAAGCRNKFTRVNYETVYIGQDQHSVRKVIGKPDKRSDEEWIYENERPFYQATISFEDGLVSAKEWVPSKDALEEYLPETGDE